MVGLIAILFLLPTSDTVTVTTYKLTAKENGPYGNVLASGFKVNKKYPGNHRVIAVSRNLLKKYPFHTKVLIEGTGSLDGEYIVEDVMNRRWHNKIDILIDWKVKPNKFNKIKITKHGSTSNKDTNNFSKSTYSALLHTYSNSNLPYKRINRYHRRGSKAEYHSTRQPIQHKRRIRKVSNDSRIIKRRKR